MRRLVFLLPMVLFLVLVLYFAQALRPDYNPQVLPSAMLDKPAPAFVLKGLTTGGPQGLTKGGLTKGGLTTGGPQDLTKGGLTEGALSRETLLGRPAVINFFASWCAPCRIEHPLLMRLSQDKRIPLYGIAYKDKPEDAARLLARSGDPYARVGLDADGMAGLDFGVYGVPETYVLDAAGVIRKRFVGPLTEDKINRELLPLLNTLDGS